MPQSSHLRRMATAALTCVSLALGTLALTPGAATAAVGDTQIAWLEVEDGAITGGPAFNSGDHGNFSGSGSYTFRETGMTSTMTVTAPAAGTYPVWIRYAAGPLSAEENVTRAMGLTTNGSRQVVSYPLTGSWESWAWARADVALNQGTNTIALNCDRGQEICRLNFDALQVGGLVADTCVATPVATGAARIFDGTFASFDQWRKAGGGGFGHQTDCTIRGFRGPGSTWTQTTTSQQANPYTLVLDWRRRDADDASSVHVGSSTNNATNPTTGYRVMIGASDTATITSADGSFTQAADATALAAAVRPVNQWNRYAVQVTPARIRVLLNGTVVNAVDRTVPLGGFIGLENRSDAAQVDFRDIQVQPGVDLGPITGPAKRATRADGTTTHPGGESTLANLVADAQRWATRGTSGGTARIAFASPTALKADLVPTGANVTYAQAAA
ncbi:MAG TPA: family 16 glycoside hydrolase, partial [Lapillicoccus sp.]|nr:family 16 glycoside hydrolase [Lapillicoccus sp.]